MRTFTAATLMGLSLGWTSCSDALTTKDVPHMFSAMNHFNLKFDPTANGDSLQVEDGWQRLDAGRVVLRTFDLPSFEYQPGIQLSLTLQSAGDPWDKSGAVFILPKGSAIDLRSFESGEYQLDSASRAYPAIAPFEDGSYAPPIELLRFITPFGVGHFSHMERADEYRPVYIPHWEDSVAWHADISHLWEELEGAVTIGVYLDTWSKEGHFLDMSLAFSAPPKLVIPFEKKHVKSLINTTKISSKQQHYDGFATSDLNMVFDLPSNASHATLHYHATGHGGHSEGDEFVACEHQLFMDGELVKKFTPWRDDCASFRAFNPSSGVWTERTFWRGDSIDERIASSDYSRSGWCPGSLVEPTSIALGSLEAGSHALRVSIPTAQTFSDTAMNFWNVAAYLTWE